MTLDIGQVTSGSEEVTWGLGKVTWVLDKVTWNSFIVF